MGSLILPTGGTILPHPHGTTTMSTVRTGGKGKVTTKPRGGPTRPKPLKAGTLSPVAAVLVAPVLAGVMDQAAELRRLADNVGVALKNLPAADRELIDALHTEGTLHGDLCGMSVRLISYRDALRKMLDTKAEG